MSSATATTSAATGQSRPVSAKAARASAKAGAKAAARALSRGLVSTKQQDFLEQDLPIRGQNFAVVSFVSPEDILKSKEVYAMGVFLTSIASDLDTMLLGVAERFQGDLAIEGTIRSIRERYNYLWSSDSMQAEYSAFRKGNEGRITSEFAAVEGSFRTSVRGLKIRGVYEGEDEARNRIKILSAKDPGFDVYMMEVGCWCPWNPNPEEVGDSEYNETELNTLVKKYKENSTERDAIYDGRKRDMIDRVGKERDIWEERKKEAAAAADVASSAADAASSMDVTEDASPDASTLVV